MTGALHKDEVSELLGDDVSLSSAASKSSTSTTDDQDETDTSNNSSRANYEEVRDMTRKETAAVDMWRDLVTGILVITACLITCGTYIYLSIEETGSFKSSFNQHVLSMQTAANEWNKNLETSAKSLSDKFTSYAQDHGSNWPFVTMPFFEVQAVDARSITNLDMVAFCPLVMPANRTAWESYSVQNQWWLAGNQDVAYTEEQEQAIVAGMNDTIPEYIFRVDDGIPTTKGLGRGPYAPRWQTNPTPDPALINFDVVSPEGFDFLLEAMIADRGLVVSGFLTEEFATSIVIPTIVDFTAVTPQSLAFYPVFESFASTAAVSGLLEMVLDWEVILAQLLHEGDTGFYFVLSSSCGGTYTYQVEGGEIKFLGLGNQHDINYAHLVQEVALMDTKSDYILPCNYTLLVYPSSELRSEFSSNMPEIFTAIIAVVFFVLAFFFFAYDKYVQKRNKKVEKQAIKTNALVSSFFPKSIRDRLFDEKDKGGSASSRRRSWGGGARLKGYLLGDDGTVCSDMGEDKPIADLFPFCTVLFGDIVGFTAWSSMREPTQVLLLLEKIYQAFDDIAKRRKVFKVETIGDCYVAVTGLPEPNKHHALAMARFARDIMYKMHEVVRSLEVILGPDTGDLSIRIGMHSGPVTAGVLRADRLRFQLFGDTVNTASRMESTGKPGCIHVSQEAADAIRQMGKAHWLRERPDKVTAKGKGILTTYFLSVTDQSSVSDSDNMMEELDDVDIVNMHPLHNKLCHYAMPQHTDLSEKTRRLVEWNVDILHRMLRQIAATRKVMDRVDPGKKSTNKSPEAQMVLDEVKEVICLPKFTSKVSKVVAQAKEVSVSQEVVKQLRDFVTNLATLYHENPFHNFEHASHVTMSVVKLLSRIVAPADLDYDEDKITDEKKLMRSIASKMHDHTYGITSDPLTQFSVVFSALIHDVDHLGVPNAQLVKEETETAKKYRGKSVAEQNSVDLAWALLMTPEYEVLRNAICSTEADRTRFRQLVVNSVMATDIVDKELKDRRNERWDKAFKGEFIEEDLNTDRNRKATIVIEHLIQASDISHTMQHWHIYRKWNERLFFELYRAYVEGRAEKNPAEFWFKGEIGFFNFYIIPLTKKLKDCGVFGVSSDEYLNYAQKNLAEWQNKGEDITKDMLQKAKEIFGERPDSVVQDREEAAPEPPAETTDIEKTEVATNVEKTGGATSEIDV